MADPPVGPGRVLALVYGFFVLAAGARSGVQIATEFSAAPLAYLLSAFAALVYAGGLTVLVAADRRRVRRGVALCFGICEAGGVLIVGLASELDPTAFPDGTVWSGYGAGYGYVPAILPALTVIWATRPMEARSGPGAGRER